MGSSSDPFFQGEEEGGFGTVFGAELNGWDVHLGPGVVVAHQAAGSLTQISAEQWGAAMEEEVDVGVHGVCPLPMGILGREDRQIRLARQAHKGRLAR
ncbi:hypothetical protein THAOC_28037, partial [Thalassiosira oceanica]